MKMGYKTEFNFALKLKKEQGMPERLCEEEIYPFIKKENRVYPINSPLDLINSDGEAVAKVVIIESTNLPNETKGKFKIVRLYNDDEKEFLKRYWRETVEYIKNKKIDDFENVKVS